MVVYYEFLKVAFINFGIGRNDQHVLIKCNFNYGRD